MCSDVLGKKLEGKGNISRKETRHRTDTLHAQGCSVCVGGSTMLAEGGIGIFTLPRVFRRAVVGYNTLMVRQVPFREEPRTFFLGLCILIH